jgi:phosphate transport system substrate-binding protein
MRRLVFSVVVLIVVLLAGCSAPTPMPKALTNPPLPLPTATTSQAAGLRGALTVAGSTTVQPLAEKMAEAFSAINPDVEITVQGGGTGVGVKSAGEGTVDIGTASRELKQEEKDTYKDLTAYTIAKDGIAMIVNPGVKVDGLTKAQVRDIFAGTIVNWKDVGGPDKPIIVVSREEGSGTRDAFQTMVMGTDAAGNAVPIVGTAILQNSNGAIRTTVAETPFSIAYLSFGYLDSSVKTLAIDGVAATEANALNGTYPVVRPLLLLTKGEAAGLAKAWIDYILSPAGQQIVTEQGYLAIK